MKWGNYCILCTDKKNLQNNSIKVWSRLLTKMETIFMNTDNSKTNEPHRFRLS